MGRQVRRVPADWQHPKSDNGHYIPLFGRSFSKERAAWDEGAAQWEKGFRDDYSGGWKPREGAEQTYSYSEWTGERPVESDYMPDWPEDQRTHWQMYEDTSEGTPISPVMETPEELARWLADNNASAFAGMTATYDQWLATIMRGFACSMVLTNGRMDSGVAALADTPSAANSQSLSEEAQRADTMPLTSGETPDTDNQDADFPAVEPVTEKQDG